MGYRLSGFDPDWSINEIMTDVPDDDNVIWKNGMIGNNIIIPDEFMGKIALVLGYDWQFGYQYTDADFKESIVIDHFDKISKCCKKPRYLIEE